MPRAPRQDLIPDDAKILRRIPPGRVAEATPDKRPQSDNFKVKKNEAGVSVNVWESDEAFQRTIEGHEEFGVVWLSVKEVRRLGLDVIFTVDPDDPDNEFHAEIRGDSTQSQCKNLAKGSIWIKRPDLVEEDQT
ncbi:MAG: hypothetical protein MN733_16085 [Nitrososphaera sp.]|nr:hypothetical protein [Nitrososphaera sp.]